ncbi:MAG: ribosome small subunit-dependent GTPase A [Clostridia bacterium]|nr:ribosome small subunit-dependent GTPase A [Clostridia bacterium]
MTGTVYECVGGLYSVKTENGIELCTARGLFRKDDTLIFTGDRVKVEDGVITEILPRKNSLTRPPVANVDKLFLVVALSSPDPNLYNIDKMLAVAEYHGIKPVIVFSKSDLDDVIGVAEIYRGLPYKVISISPDSENGIDEIREEINNSVCVMSGLSGVGKSTLLNRLAPDLDLKTGEISKKLGRGKNTTRSSRFFDVSGGVIADTPGFSSLSFESYDIKNRAFLADCFPEFEDYKKDCLFTECSHTKEKGCGVLAALKKGKIKPTRHENYCRMYEELGVYKPWEDKEQK